MNYGEIKAAVIAYSGRSDLLPTFPTFLALAESRIYNGTRPPDAPIEPLRILPMLKTVTLAGVTLPTDFLSMKRVSAIVGGRKQSLDYSPLEAMGPSELQQGQPTNYGYNAAGIVFSPTFTNAVEIVYYGRFTTPTGDTSANWLTDNAPEIYIAALLIEVAVRTRDDAMEAKQSARYTSAMNGLQNKDSESRHSGATLRIRTDSRKYL